MKSFSQFWEEATLSDLERQHAQSPEGRAQARKSAVLRARQEASQRVNRAKTFTQKNKKRALTGQREAQERLAKQRRAARELRAKTEQQKQISTQRTSQIGRNIRSTARGTIKLTKKIVKAVSKRKKTQPNP